MLKTLASLDRRIVFLGVAVFALIPLMFPLGLPVATTPEVKSIYDKIEKLPERSPILISMDFDPASAAELLPMATALVHHALARNLRVITVSLWAPAPGIMDSLLADAARETGREHGKDWVDLGYQAGGYALVIRLGQSIKTTFREDSTGTPTADMEVLKGVDSLKNIAYQVELAAGEPGIGSWYYFGKEKFHYDMGVGCTSVGAPEWYPFLQTGQLNGLIGGMRGAAEYEKLIERPGAATPAMDPLSTTSLLVIALVVFGNIMFFLTGGTKKR